MTRAQLLAQVAHVVLRDADEAARPTPDLMGRVAEPNIDEAGRLHRLGGRLLDEAYEAGFDGDGEEAFGA